jgi:hypothetical protein
MACRTLACSDISIYPALDRDALVKMLDEALVTARPKITAGAPAP